MEIRRIGVLSAAKILGALYLVFGLIAGLIFACVALTGLTSLAAVAGSDLGELGGGVAGAIVGLCFVPIIYGVIGAIGGAIGALIYNLVAGWIGGIEIEFAEGKP